MTRKIGDVIWTALQCAKQDRLSLANAYHGDTKEKVVRDCLADIRAFERLQVRLFGTTKSQRQAMIDKMTPKSLAEIFKEEV